MTEAAAFRGYRRSPAERAMGDFKQLVAWQKAHAFALAVHAAFKGTSGHTCRRACARRSCAPSTQFADNLAEGCATGGARRELARYADMAYASSKEVENDLIRARGPGNYRRDHVIEDLLTQGDEVSRLCFGLARTPPNERRCPVRRAERSEVRRLKSAVSRRANHVARQPLEPRVAERPHRRQQSAVNAAASRYLSTVLSPHCSSNPSVSPPGTPSPPPPYPPSSTSRSPETRTSPTNSGRTLR